MESVHSKSTNETVVSDRFIVLSEPDLRGREREFLVKCIDDGWVSTAGPFVTRLEDAFAVLSERNFAVSATTGTAALQLALTACGIGAGAKVIIPDWTFAATANAVIHTGASPVFVDIDPHTLTIDPVLVERRLGRGGIDAVIAVDVLGHICDMDRLTDICLRFEVPLISDAAGSLGAKYKNRPAGKFGVAAIFSLNGNKIVTGGGGGIIVTDNAEFAQRARHLSTQARPGIDYIHDAAGFNFRLTNVNAAVALAQLERLDEMLARRATISSAYDKTLAVHSYLRPVPVADWADRNGWLYSTMTNTEAEASDLVAHLNSEGIEARPFWRSLSHQSPYSDYEYLAKGVSRSISGRVVSLPSGSSLDDSSLARILKSLRAWTPAGGTGKS